MSKYPLKSTSTDTSLAATETPAAPADVEVAIPATRVDGFIGFRYSYTEFSSQAGRTQVKARQVRLEDGRLSTEAFEGELDGTVYDKVVQQAQQQVLGQAAWLLRSMSWLLPPVRSTGSDHE